MPTGKLVVLISVSCFPAGGRALEDVVPCRAGPVSPKHPAERGAVIVRLNAVISISVDFASMLLDGRE
jgi:hypothetical protein